MNMKKTIAAVAACAMAVSAMATTVSAVELPDTYKEAKSLNYDLTKKTETQKVAFEFNYKDYNQSVNKIQLRVSKDVVSQKPDKFKVVVRNKGGITTTAYEFTFTAKTDDADYNGTTSYVDKDGFYGLDVDLAKAGGLNQAIAQAFTVPAGNALDMVFTVDGLDTKSQDLDQTKVNRAIGAVTGSSHYDNTGYYETYLGLDGKALNDGKTDALTRTWKDGKGSATTDMGLLSNATVGGLPLVYVAVDPDDADGDSFISLGLPKGTLSKVQKKVAFRTGVARSTDDAFKQSKYVFNSINTGDSRLDEVGVAGVGKKYNNASAVINDMIRVYDDVIFKFNTVSAKIANDESGEYRDWGATDKYTKFPQDLYNLFGDENTTYVYADAPTYTFNNLFQAALVANNGYTMQQNSITPFEYQETSVSFSWNDMTGGKEVASVANSVLSLQLLTSDVWFWESMDVTGYWNEADDGAAGEGAEGDGDTIDDGSDADDTDDTDIDDTDDTDIDDTDDTDVDDVDTDDTTDVDTDDTTDTDDGADVDADTSNPQTGNAPIALAVIPVALAAAAVVAKKRG